MMEIGMKFTLRAVTTNTFGPLDNSLPTLSKVGLTCAAVQNKTFTTVTNVLILANTAAWLNGVISAGKACCIQYNTLVN